MNTETCSICGNTITTGFILQGNLGVTENGQFGGLYGSNHLNVRLEANEATPPNEILRYTFHCDCFINYLQKIKLELQPSLECGDNLCLKNLMEK